MEQVAPVAVVEKQLKFYNSHDIDGFISAYSQEIQLFNLGENEPFLKGHEALRERYTQRFSNPMLHAHIADRMAIGNKVIDFEHVSGIKDNEISKVVAIYEVIGGLIQKVWFMRE